MKHKGFKFWFTPIYIYFFVVICAFISSEKSSTSPKSQWLTPVLSPEFYCFYLLYLDVLFYLLYSDLRYFWVNFWVWCGEGGVQLHSSVCEHLIFWAPFIEKTVLSLLNVLGFLVYSQLAVYVMVYFWPLYSIGLNVLYAGTVCFSYCSFESVLKL